MRAGVRTGRLHQFQYNPVLGDNSNACGSQIDWQLKCAQSKTSFFRIRRSALVALAKLDNDVANQLCALTATALRRNQDYIRPFAMPTLERVAQRLPSKEDVELPMRQGMTDYLALAIENSVSRVHAIVTTRCNQITSIARDCAP